MLTLGRSVALSLGAVVPPRRGVAELVLALMSPELMERSASDQSASVLSTSLGSPSVSPFPAAQSGSPAVEDPATAVCTMADLEAMVKELDQVDATLSELR